MREDERAPAAAAAAAGRASPPLRCQRYYDKKNFSHYDFYKCIVFLLRRYLLALYIQPASRRYVEKFSTVRHNIVYVFRCQVDHFSSPSLANEGALGGDDRREKIIKISITSDFWHK